MPSDTIRTPWYWEPFDLFRDAGPEARGAFFDRSIRQTYAKGQNVFMASDAGKRAFFLERGVVKIFNLSEVGTQTIFWYCMPGDVFGAGGITGSAQQSVYAQVTEPSIIHSLSRPDFEGVMTRHPQLAINMVRLMGARLRLACDSLVAVAEQRTEARLARVLLRLAHNYGVPDGDGIVLGMRLSHQELADMIACTRQTVNALLHDFSDAGWIRLDGRTIAIVSSSALQRIGDGLEGLGERTTMSVRAAG